MSKFRSSESSGVRRAALRAKVESAFLRYLDAPTEQNYQALQAAKQAVRSLDRRPGRKHVHGPRHG